MPIFIFCGQGFEHSVVNMFVIPTRMVLGAKVTIADWWLWNQIPVTIGNLLGGWLLIGLPMYLTYGRRPAADGSLTGSVATLQECFDKAGLIWSSHPQSPVCSNGANLNRK
jgi:Formate/nitrite transporter